MEVKSRFTPRQNGHATPYPQPPLAKVGPISYTTPAPALVAEFLRERGWVDVPLRSPHELARLRWPTSRQLVIAYKSGSIVNAGGARPKTANVLAVLEVWS